MPEGPTISILAESLNSFARSRVTEASGKSSEMDYVSIQGSELLVTSTWGKHILIEFENFYLNIHLMLFGSCTINSSKKMLPTLHLGFESGEINFYASRIKLTAGSPKTDFDFTADILRPEFNIARAVERMEAMPKDLICDVLLDQHIFAGLGNKLKDEILFAARVHPESRTHRIPSEKLLEMARLAPDLAFRFREWTLAAELEDHLLVHSKDECPRNLIPLEKKILGKTKRKAFYCQRCQELYD